MNLTHQAAIPSSVLSVIENSVGHPRPTFDSMHVTTLIDAPQRTVLRMRHWDSITQDCRSFAWLLLGQAVHKLLDQNAPPHALCERAHTFILAATNTSIIFRPDIIETTDGLTSLTDYKTTSAWAMPSRYDQIPAHHRLQVLAYALGASAHDVLIDQACIFYLAKDWSLRMAELNPNYPQTPMRAISFTVTHDLITEINQILNERICTLQQMADMSNDMLPGCTPTERWTRDAAYVVYKQGNKRACRNGIHVINDKDSPDFAKHTAQVMCNRLKKKNPKNDYEVRLRCGDHIRCKHYCEVSHICHQYQSELAEQTTEKDNT